MSEDSSLIRVMCVCEGGDIFLKRKTRFDVEKIKQEFRPRQQ